MTPLHEPPEPTPDDQRDADAGSDEDRARDETTAYDGYDE